MVYNPKKPVVVQSDRSILLETDNPLFEAARDALAQFAELDKSPEYFHTYRITPLSLWNAASAGLAAEDIIGALEAFTKYDIPQNIIQDIRDYVARYGCLKLIKEGETALVLQSEDMALITEISNHKAVDPFLEGPLDKKRLLVKKGMRGRIKQALIKIGFPVEDLAGYVDGKPVDLELQQVTKNGKEWHMRQYQRDSIDVFYAAGTSRGGSGVLVLPCGAGKNDYRDRRHRPCQAMHACPDDKHYGSAPMERRARPTHEPGLRPGGRIFRRD